jgi:glycosyltransferase involved in cell wall biosynthesis
MSVISLPGWLASSSRLSSLKPLLWWLYSAFLFPVEPRARILSTTHHALPFRKGQIITIHDLRPYFMPDTLMQRLYFHWLLPRALRRCDGILTVSATSKQLLIDHYHVQASAVHIIPNAIKAQFFDDCGPCRPIEQEPPYLLLVGCSWKHKNAQEILEMHRTWGSRYRLKLLAGHGQYRSLLIQRVRELGLQEKVDFPNSVDDSGLLRLYQGCAALVYPSLMEGFGLPPLEAMACRRPVIVSDIPVFRELYGEAPIYVQLGSVDSWTQAFSELETKYGSERTEAGLRQARMYSPTRMRDQLRSAIEGIWGASAVARAA